MAGIPSEFIDQLLDRVDIVDVISPRVTLKKAGKDYQALCPFHTENSPSFTVSQNKQFYHCFGCGKSGSAIGFLMEFEGMEFIDSIETLAQSAGMEVPNQGNFNTTNNSKNLYQIVENANRYFVNQFHKNQEVQNYIYNRDISPETCQVFQVGYAPNSWDGLLKKINHTNQSEMQKAGLLAQNDNGKVYDKFRSRIMFPIQDRRGRVIAFGGRALQNDQKPKYLNSPETPLFHKGKELYGLNIARKYSNAKNIIVVEGYMDVIALHEVGIKNAVATLGTATSQHHIVTLLRSYEEIVFCFDGDQAGIDAAWKALILSLPVYRDDKSIRFLFLPNKHDPDTYVKEFGADSFHQQLNDASMLSSFLLKKLQEDLDIKTIDGRAKFIDKSKEYLSELPKGQFRKLLTEEIGQIAKSQIDFKPKKQPKKLQNIDQWTPVRKAITILLNQPSLVINFPETMEFTLIQQNGIDILYKIVEFCRKSPTIRTAALLENFRNEESYSHLCRLTTTRLDLNDEQMLLELKDIKKHFEKSIRKIKINRLRQRKVNNGLTDEEKQQLVKLLTNQII